MDGLYITLGLIVLAYFTGSWFERRHYQSIHRREDALHRIPATTSPAYDESRTVRRAELVHGSVVVSVDHFKRFFAGLRMLFGGELGAYASLIDRGRREAVLRMKEQAAGAEMFINCRLVTSSLSQGQGKALGSVEVLAYGTALWFEQDAQSEERAAA